MGERTAQSTKHFGYGTGAILGGAGAVALGAVAGTAVMGVGVLGGAALIAGGALYNTAVVLDAPLHIVADRSMLISNSGDTKSPPSNEPDKNEKVSLEAVLPMPGEPRPGDLVNLDQETETGGKISMLTADLEKLEQSLEASLRYSEGLKDAHKEFVDCLPVGPAIKLESLADQISSTIGINLTNKCNEGYDKSLEKLIQDIKIRDLLIN